MTDLNARLAEAGYRLRAKRRFLRSPITIIERREVRNHCRDLAGSGHYDEWQTEHWVPASPNQVVADLGIPFAV